MSMAIEQQHTEAIIAKIKAETKVLEANARLLNADAAMREKQVKEYDKGEE